MIPCKITSRDIPLSESMSAAIEEQLQLLQRFFSQIINCEIVLSRPHTHHKTNRFHHVQIRLKTLHRNIIVNREPEKNERHISFHLAVQDAFHALERRLEDEVTRIRHSVRNRQKISIALPSETEGALEGPEFAHQM